MPGLSSLAEIKLGDQVRVLGDKSGDGTSIVAERIVSGSFRQIAATISSVNAEAGEIVIKDPGYQEDAHGPREFRLDHEKGFRRPWRRLSRGDTSPAPRKARISVRCWTISPSLPLSELKPGDAIMLSSTTGSDPARVTAVMLLAGVEPLLAASPTATRDIMSGWNLGGGEGAQ